MDQQTQTLLLAFAKSCCKPELQTDDWERLNALAIHVHRHGVDLTPRVVKMFLMTQQCSIQKAGYLSSQFGHLLTVLRVYDEEKRQAAVV